LLVMTEISGWRFVRQSFCRRAVVVDLHARERPQLSDTAGEREGAKILEIRTGG